MKDIASLKSVACCSKISSLNFCVVLLTGPRASLQPFHQESVTPFDLLSLWALKLPPDLGYLFHGWGIPQLLCWS